MTRRQPGRNITARRLIHADGKTGGCMPTARSEKVDRNGRDSLMHPGRGGLEPVDDLGVVYGKENDADEANNERDVVPCARVSDE